MDPVSIIVAIIRDVLTVHMVITKTRQRATANRAQPGHITPPLDRPVVQTVTLDQLILILVEIKDVRNVVGGHFRTRRDKFRVYHARKAHSRTHLVRPAVKSVALDDGILPQAANNAMIAIMEHIRTSRELPPSVNHALKVNTKTKWVRKAVSIAQQDTVIPGKNKKDAIFVQEGHTRTNKEWLCAKDAPQGCIKTRLGKVLV